MSWHYADTTIAGAARLLLPKLYSKTLLTGQRVRTRGAALGGVAFLGAAVQALLAVRGAPQLQLRGGRLVGRQARIQQAVRQQLQAPGRNEADLHRTNRILAPDTATIPNNMRGQCKCDHCNRVGVS